MNDAGTWKPHQSLNQHYIEEVLQYDPLSLLYNPIMFICKYSIAYVYVSYII